MEETGVAGENHRTATNRWQTLSHNEYISPWMRFELTTLLVIYMDCSSNCKFNYHTIPTTVWGYQREKKNMWQRGTDDTMAKWQRGTDDTMAKWQRGTDDTMAKWQRVKRQQSTKFYTETLRLNNRKAWTQILQKVIISFSTSDTLCLYDLSIGFWNCSGGVVFCCFSLYIYKNIDLTKYEIIH